MNPMFLQPTTKFNQWVLSMQSDIYTAGNEQAPDNCKFNFPMLAKTYLYPILFLAVARCCGHFVVILRVLKCKYVCEIFSLVILYVHVLVLKLCAHM